MSFEVGELVKYRTGRAHYQVVEIEAHEYDLLHLKSGEVFNAIPEWKLEPVDPKGVSAELRIKANERAGMAIIRKHLENPKCKQRSCSKHPKHF